MPIKGNTKRSSTQIKEAVDRYLAGESAVVLAKYYKISKPGFYLWVKKYKEETLERSKRAGMSPEQAEQSTKQDLVIEVQSLRNQVRQLREKLFELMLQSGKL